MIRSDKIINGFCFLKNGNVTFIDLYTEKPKEYKLDAFVGFIKNNKIDEYCLFLANKDEEVITPLYKYKLSSKDKNRPIVAKDTPVNKLIDVCYKICIKIFKPDTDILS
jgi:hypothetical protein